MSGDSSQFENLSTRRLESILRESLTDRSLTPESLLAISRILEKRDVGKGMGPPDVEAAWDRFLERQRDNSTGSPPGGASRLKPVWKDVLQRCAVLAVCIFTLASAFLTTQAFGYDPIGAIIHWTADVFSFRNGRGRTGVSLRELILGTISWRPAKCLRISSHHGCRMDLRKQHQSVFLLPALTLSARNTLMGRVTSHSICQNTTLQITWKASFSKKSF